MTDSLPNSQSPVQLSYAGSVELNDTYGVNLPVTLISPVIFYEATYNYNTDRIGFFIHSEIVPGVGKTVIERYPIRKGRNQLAIAPGQVTPFYLGVVPSALPRSPILLTLKIWSPTMPLSRSGGSVSITPQISTSVTASSLTASTDSATVLPANPDRKGATIYNASTARLYIELGDSVSSTDFQVLMEANEYYEIPYGYTGIISGVWASANGFATIREFE